MLVNTSRFGEVPVADDRVIMFPKGLLGFSRYKRYVLMQPGADDSPFFWLQSTDAPELAFVVTDPSGFVPTYRVPVKEDQMHDLGLQTLNDAQVFVIVNKHEHMLTGNLQGPLVINVKTRCGEQMVLSDRRFTTRVPLVELPMAVEALSA
jgi:flagellar assembly factor FliW